MPTRKKKQQQFDRIVAEQRDKRYPSCVNEVLRDAGYQPAMLYRLEWALHCKWSSKLAGSRDPSMDEALAQVAEEFGLTYTPPQ